MRPLALAMTLSCLGSACGASESLPLDDLARDAGARDAEPDLGVGLDLGVTLDVGPDAGPVDGMAPDTGPPGLVLGGPAVEGTIDAPGEIDVHHFDGIPGQYVRIYAARLRESDMDPVLELYDPNGQRVAAVDDLSPNPLGYRDAELIYRVTATGRYVIQVHDWVNWADEPEGPVGGPTYTYALTARWLDDAAPLETIAPETGDRLADAVPIVTSTRSTVMIIGAAFDRPYDLDVYRFDLTRSIVFRADLMPLGVPGHGGTSTAARLVMTSSRGIEAIAPLNLLSGLRVPLEPGPHLLRIEHSGAALGPNPFYVLKARAERFGGAYAEPRANDNDSPSGPGYVQVRSDGPTQIFGTLPEGDTDYFAIAGPDFRGSGWFCVSKSWGSGVEGLTLTRYDGQLQPMASATETFDGSLYLDQPGSYYEGYVFGISRGPQLPGNPSVFYLCESW